MPVCAYDGLWYFCKCVSGAFRCERLPWYHLHFARLLQHLHPLVLLCLRLSCQNYITLWKQQNYVTLWKQQNSVTLWNQHNYVTLWNQQNYVTLWNQQNYITLPSFCAKRYEKWTKRL